MVSLFLKTSLFSSFVFFALTSSRLLLFSLILRKRKKCPCSLNFYTTKKIMRALDLKELRLTEITKIKIKSKRNSKNKKLGENKN